MVLDAAGRSKGSTTLRVLLVGNYVPDAQESMRRYAALLFEGLSAAGHAVTLALPRTVLNASSRAADGLWKWVGYVDKYVLSIPELAEAARRADVVHVCDHANSVYVPLARGKPHIVTCHDLLAVRGALGEQTDCPATFIGRRLQYRILKGLGRADALACVTRATMNDARKLLHGYNGRFALTPNALNHPYSVIDADASMHRLASISPLQDGRPYVLSVGSNLRRKNREAVLHAMALLGSQWQGWIVFAGQPLNAELKALAARLRLLDCIVEVAKPSNDTLEALYNRALALLFPSRFEGFGWPIIEAQACGCPVICGDREPLPEVAGGAALMHDPDDYQGLGEGVLALLRDADLRQDLINRGLRNAARYDRATMIEQFVGLYRQFPIAA
jgi:glycosyltransferase involved in cell wall biosynthesis